MDWIGMLGDCLPAAPSEEIAWDKIAPLFAASRFSDTEGVPQDPLFHGEGDVMAHTRLVCRELNSMRAYHALAPLQKAALFAAAVLHDMGKVKTTRLEDGRWTSPHHASVGSRMARVFLWQACGLCGSPENQRFRETVCALIRHHMLPVRLMEQDAPEQKARQVAALGDMVPDFSWHLLGLLAEADVRGRVADDVRDALTKVELARLLAEEARCLYGPYPFYDACVRRACLAGRNVSPDQPLYDGTWGEVILMAGLPGTGKDTWIARNVPDLPMVSLDEIRRAMKIAPTEAQGAVIQAAQEKARELLRKKRPFVWNATNITREMRQRQVDLFERYGARVRIVYLEAPWAVQLERNAGRAGEVPAQALEKMLEKTVPPATDEARTVEWLCV